MNVIIIITIKCFQKNLSINNTKVLYYDRIKVSKGTDVNKNKCFKRVYYCLDKKGLRFN